MPINKNHGGRLEDSSDLSNWMARGKEMVCAWKTRKGYVAVRCARQWQEQRKNNSPRTSRLATARLFTGHLTSLTVRQRKEALSVPSLNSMTNISRTVRSTEPYQYLLSYVAAIIMRLYPLRDIVSVEALLAGCGSQGKRVGSLATR
jgi:hypothetical protein